MKTHILQYLSYILGRPVQQINYFESLENDLQLDSIDRLDLIFKLENMFGVELSAEAIEKVQTVDDLCYAFEQSRLIPAH
ncbi:MAG: acyl carrier protein [Saprospiraceae bacterium]|nr:acyl carrier protein [Saprospiraceae bacterium]MCB9321442.1 acyl carrier protein [Lewinellaceae bacterium]